MPSLLVIASDKTRHPQAIINAASIIKKLPTTLSWTTLLLTIATSISYAHADSMSVLIAQKSTQSVYNAQDVPSQIAVPPARVSTRTTIQRAGIRPITNNTFHSPAINNSYRYPEVQRRAPSVLPAFLSGSYDNVDSEYLPLLSQAESHSSLAARGVISTARTMALNERAIIQGGCWDYLDAVFKRAGVTRDTRHKGTYAEGPYAHSSEIEVGDWLYYINHGYNGVEHSGLFVGWVDEAAKQALILSYAGESRHEPARYRVYDLSNVYQIMRPMV